MIFDLLETKRKHVKKYCDIIPDRELIEDALWKAWKTTPSKNNFMAYQLDVYGPDKEMEKEIMWNFAVANHINAEDVAVEKGFADKTQEGEPNPYYQHIRYNPYLFVWHGRVCTKANPFYQRQIDNGHFADQMYDEYVEHISGSTNVEVGIFAANLTVYLLENGLDMSYNSCFVRDKNVWQRSGFNWVTQDPILMMSVGYAERYRRQDLEDWGVSNDDYKPEIDDLIRWL